MKEKTSLGKIGEMTGYSRTTVFNVLNGRGGASKETAERIMKIAAEMKYTSAETKKKIKLVVYKSSGTVVEDTPFFAQLFAGIESECRERSYSLEIIYLYDSEENYERHRLDILQEEADGIILLGTEMDLERFLPYEASDIPIVICDNHFFSEKISCVCINNKDAVENVVNQLIRGGHKKIGYLRGATRINNFRERADGIRAALGKNGLPEVFENTVTLRPSTEKAYQDMKQWLKDNNDLPTVYFADNDLIAFGAIKAMREAGIRVPEDVSVVGFDDMPFCDIFNPPLSTVRVNKENLGRLSVQKLDRDIRDRKNQKKPVSTMTLLGAQYVQRSSVRKIDE